MPRIVNFEGKRIQFPDDATDEEIGAALSGSAEAAPPADPPIATRVDQPAETAAPEEPFRSRVGWQGVGRGVADLAFPLDMLNAGVNLGLEGVDAASQALGGPEIDYRLLPASDAIAGASSEVAESAGLFDTIDPEEMSGSERLIYEANRFGSGAGFGAGAIMKAPQAVKQAPVIGRAVTSLAKPYEKNAARTLSGDVAAGAGAGAGLAGYEEYAPDYVTESGLDPIARVTAMLAGGLGGGGLKEMATGGAKGAYRYGEKALGLDLERGLPPNAVTREPFNSAEYDRAAGEAQTMASNPAVAAKNIQDYTYEMGPFITPGSTPTAGSISDDVGFMSAENAARRRDPVPFIERDQGVNTQARETVDALAPRGARGRDFTNEAEAIQRRRVDQASTRLDTARGQQSAAEAERAAQGQEVAQYGGRGPEAAREIDRTVVDRTLRPMQEESSARYAAVDPARSADLDVTPLVEQAKTVRDSLGTLNDPAKVIPRGLLRRIEGTVDEVGDTQAPVSVGDIVDVLPEISNTITRAQKAQNYTLADNLMALRESMNGMLQEAADAGDEAAARALDAQQNYKETVGATFGRGQGDEGYKFRKDFNLDRENRSTTPPSQTAGRFLKPGQPEKAQSLQRIVDASASPEEGRKAVREYLLDDLVQGGVVDAKTGALRSDVLRKWRDRWAGSLDAAPGLRKEIDDLVVKAQSGEGLSTKLGKEVQAAEAKLGSVRTNKGVLARALGKNPEKAVESVFSGGDPERDMRALTKLVGRNDQARDGLKAAVRDYLVEYKTTSAVEKTKTGANPVSFAKLDDLFKKNERALAEVYSPEEMNKLRAVHKMLAPSESRKLSATTGSQTAERMNADNMRMLEVALKGWFGMLRGGGIFRTIKIALQSLPSNRQNVDQIIRQMWFDPELAQHLMTRELDVGGDAWNRKLIRLMALGEGARATERPDEAQETSE